MGYSSSMVCEPTLFVGMNIVKRWPWYPLVYPLCLSCRGLHVCLAAEVFEDLSKELKKCREQFKHKHMQRENERVRSTIKLPMLRPPHMHTSA